MTNLPDWLNVSTDTTSTPITEESIRATWEKLKEQVPDGPHRHLVHPRAEGWSYCLDCFAPVHIEIDSEGRRRDTSLTTWRGQK